MVTFNKEKTFQEDLIRQGYHILDKSKISLAGYYPIKLEQAFKHVWREFRDTTPTVDGIYYALACFALSNPVDGRHSYESGCLEIRVVGIDGENLIGEIQTELPEGFIFKKGSQINIKAGNLLGKPKANNTGLLNTRTTYEYITSDFIKLWDSLRCQNIGESAGGNHAFSLLTFVFLEWICSILKDKPKLYKTLSEELCQLNPIYFERICKRKITSKLKLPCVEEKYRGCCILDVIYHLSRHGIAHAYMPSCTFLKDRTLLSIVTHMEPKTIKEISAMPRSERKHLSYERTDNPHYLYIKVVPVYLFLDLKEAIEKCKVVSLVPTYKCEIQNILHDVSRKDLVSN